MPSDNYTLAFTFLLGTIFGIAGHILYQRTDARIKDQGGIFGMFIYITVVITQYV